MLVSTDNPKMVSIITESPDSSTTKINQNSSRTYYIDSPIVEHTIDDKQTKEKETSMNSAAQRDTKAQEPP